jgi:nucleotide-binding universal stress UspA family protein
MSRGDVSLVVSVPMYETILVATDGSERARKAAEYAVDLAAQYDATVHAIFVVDTHLLDEPALSTAELSTDLIEDAGHGFLVEVERLAEERGVPFERRSVHGVPKFEILEYAADVSADLIVMGSIGHTPGHRVGSVADYVFEHADQPVMTL